MSVKKLFTPICIAILLSSTLSITACGFQLRGYQTNDLTDAQSIHKKQVALKIANNKADNKIKSALTKQLNQLGVYVHTKPITNSNISVIKVENIKFRKYELVGILTEVRIVLTADVSYSINKNGQIINHTQPLQVENSYQYNKASVSIEDQQGQYVRNGLYDEMARQITDQYIALTMPEMMMTQPK
ncbi:MAG: hypothetical protein CSA42_03165 [Gammaproteobacteria bacterium]|nr:MAG: hypothetical protein CSA42_03165 [Gammaproteobacteria bacterium]